MNKKHKAFDWWFLLKLVFVTLIGVVIAFIVYFVFVIVIVYPAIFGEGVDRFPDLVAGLLMTACFGSVIALIEWIVIRRHLARSTIWIGATLLGFLICSPIIIFLSGGIGPYITPQAGLMMTVALGSVMGFFQWLTIRKIVSQSALWIGISLASWIVAGLIGIALNTLSVQMGPILYWIGSLFFGIILSAAGLMWLLKRGTTAGDDENSKIEA